MADDTDGTPPPQQPVAAPAAPGAQANLGYGKQSEVHIDQVNQWMRQAPWYQQQRQAWGQGPGHPTLNKTQSQQILKMAQANGVTVDGGHNGMESTTTATSTPGPGCATMIVAGMAPPVGTGRGGRRVLRGLGGALGGSAAAGGGAAAAAPARGSPPASDQRRIQGGLSAVQGGLNGGGWGRADRRGARLRHRAHPGAGSGRGRWLCQDAAHKRARARVGAHR